MGMHLVVEKNEFLSSNVHIFIECYKIYVCKWQSWEAQI